MSVRIPALVFRACFVRVSCTFRARNLSLVGERMERVKFTSAFD